MKLKPKIKITLHLYSSLALLLLVSSCGGGTIGTGIGSSQSGVDLLGSGAGAKAIVCYLHFTVQTQTGSRRSGARVSIQSGDRHFSGITDSRGYLSLPVAIASGEPLLFTVHDGGKIFSTEEFVSPAGESSLRRTLVLRPSGTIDVQE